MNALTTRREIFFIDARIEGYESILVGMDPAADTHILNQQTDGMSQILDTLAQSDSRYDAVHLITHGSSAQIDLPGTLINADNLQQHKASLERIGGHLSADADFLVYGCNIGGDEAGRLFTQEFSKILGVDVATSDDLTGTQALGGDAVLEVRSGRIETPAIAEEIWDESAVLLVREVEPNYGTTVTASSVASTPSTATPPRISSVSNARAEEGNTLRFTVDLDHAPSEATTYRFATYRHSSGAQGDDFHSRNSQLTFSSGQTRKNIEVRTKEDTQDEGNEIFYLYVADFGEAPPAPSSQSFQSSRNRGTGTIIDDDDAPTPRISSVSNARAEEGNTLRFTVDLDHAPSEATTYRFATYRHNSGAQGDDFHSRNSQLTFSSGQTRKNIEVRTKEDTQDEGNEIFYLYVADFGEAPPAPSSQSFQSSRNRGTGTIIDDDDAPTPRISSVSNARAEEGNTLRFTVDLDHAPSEATTYRFATYRHNSGAQGDDFHSRNSQLTFSSGQTRKNIEVRTKEDTQDEGNEIFYLLCRRFR